eukprot:6710012-Alexandrium_andersonii.AAC.1
MCGRLGPRRVHARRGQGALEDVGVEVCQIFVNDAPRVLGRKRQNQPGDFRRDAGALGEVAAAEDVDIGLAASRCAAPSP